MYKTLSGIHPPKDGDTLWRYLTFEKFASFLSTKSLYFARADQFKDPFEGHVPQLITDMYERENKRLGKEGSQAVTRLWKNWRKCVMCSCWHQGDHELMAMWERYSMHNSGIAIKTTPQRLKKSFTRKEGVDVYIGKVRYINYQRAVAPQNIRAMHTIYSPFFYKRKAFEYEKEVRAIIDTSRYVREEFFRKKEGFSLQPQDFDLKTLEKRMECLKIDEDKIGQSLHVDLKTLISEVIISPHTDNWVTEAIKSMVQKYGFDFEVTPSTLLDKPS